MKKQVKKLSLNKKTISNLTTVEMSKHAGGGNTGWTLECSHPCPQKTKNGNTCPGHTCYN